MPASGLLFTDTDLSTALQREVTDWGAAAAERKAWGWLKPVLGLDVRPDPVPDDVWTWAIELGEIAYNHPRGGTMRLGSLSVEFPTERKDEILERAAGGSRVPAPEGSFPTPSRYPDPSCW